MPTLAQPPDSDPQPYFRADPAPDWPAIDACLARLGLPPAA